VEAKEKFEHNEVVDEGIRIALNSIAAKYGSGDNDGERPKDYHNLMHTRDVLDAARSIAIECFENGKIHLSDIPLVELAAAFHDVEQDLESGVNEKESARIAEEWMMRNGFTQDKINKVKQMILATMVYFDDSGMFQSASDDILTQIICDADLSTLGEETGVYYSDANGLFKEITHSDTHDEAYFKMQTPFYKNQVRLLTNHKYYTSEAGQLYPKQSNNLDFAKELLTHLA